MLIFNSTLWPKLQSLQCTVSLPFSQVYSVCSAILPGVQYAVCSAILPVVCCVFCYIPRCMPCVLIFSLEYAVCSAILPVVCHVFCYSLRCMPCFLLYWKVYAMFFSILPGVYVMCLGRPPLLVNTFLTKEDLKTQSVSLLVFFYLCLLSNSYVPQ